MATYQFMCLECGHAFEVFLSKREIDSEKLVECPACGSNDTSRTFDEDEELEESVEEGDAPAEEEGDEDDFTINLDDE
ncbi:MAG: zinc ribbon domain-containing protein [bacterium]